MKHTPGPWKYDPSYGAVISNGKVQKLILSTFNPSHKFTDTDEANMILAASAPKMLEVLELAEATIERLNRHNSADGTLQVIREAINTAKESETR